MQRTITNIEETHVELNVFQNILQPLWRALREA